MKKICVIMSILLSAMLLVPLAAMKKNVQASSPVRTVMTKEAETVNTFRVYDAETKKVTELSSDDYILGVVAAEMPALYDEEALKAQAVASYTYACYRKSENSSDEYDITTDHTVDQSYVSPEKLKEKWGDKADEYTEKIKSAIKAVSGYMITYEGSPILSVYHAISSGMTESAENVWGGKYEYLTAVNSIGDKLSPNYISTVSFSEAELKEKLKSICDFSGDAAKYFDKCEKSDSGTVLNVKVCGKDIKGSQIRKLLDLRSSCFDVAYSDGSFTFTVYGYGHGVGMSQYGANYMAKQGSSFEEILTGYYTGCKVEKIDVK